MAVQRVLLVGAKGQLGRAVQQHLQDPRQGTGDLLALGRTELDLSDRDRVAAVVADYCPTVIVNAAAYTAVDRAESEPDRAKAINATVPGELAAAAATVGAHLLHVSTDYVFNGRLGRPWREEDPTEPLSVYGRTKAAGEAAVRSQRPDHHWILRTAWVYGAGSTGNFVKTMVRLAQGREELRVVQDQVGSPTWTQDIAAAIATLIRPDPPVPPGTYHYTSSGVASWYDFTVAIVEELRALAVPLTVQRVVPIPSSAYPTPVERPAYSVLDTQKITAVLGTPPPHWRTSLRSMLTQYVKEIAP